MDGPQQMFLNTTKTHFTSFKDNIFATEMMRTVSQELDAAFQLSIFLHNANPFLHGYNTTNYNNFKFLESCSLIPLK